MGVSGVAAICGQRSLTPPGQRLAVRDRRDPVDNDRLSLTVNHSGFIFKGGAARRVAGNTRRQNRG